MKQVSDSSDYIIVFTFTRPFQIEDKHAQVQFQIFYTKKKIFSAQRRLLGSSTIKITKLLKNFTLVPEEHERHAEQALKFDIPAPKFNCNVSLFAYTSNITVFIKHLQKPTKMNNAILDLHYVMNKSSSSGDCSLFNLESFQVLQQCLVNWLHEETPSKSMKTSKKSKAKSADFSLVPIASFWKSLVHSNVYRTFVIQNAVSSFLVQLMNQGSILKRSFLLDLIKPLLISSNPDVKNLIFPLVGLLEKSASIALSKPSKHRINFVTHVFQLLRYLDLKYIRLLLSTNLLKVMKSILADGSQPSLLDESITMIKFFGILYRPQLEEAKLFELLAKTAEKCVANPQLGLGCIYVLSKFNASSPEQLSSLIKSVVARFVALDIQNSSRNLDQLCTQLLNIDPVTLKLCIDDPAFIEKLLSIINMAPHIATKIVRLFIAVDASVITLMEAGLLKSMTAVINSSRPEWSSLSYLLNNLVKLSHKSFTTNMDEIYPLLVPLVGEQGPKEGPQVQHENNDNLRTSAEISAINDIIPESQVLAQGSSQTNPSSSEVEYKFQLPSNELKYFDPCLQPLRSADSLKLIEAGHSISLWSSLIKLLQNSPINIKLLVICLLSKLSPPVLIALELDYSLSRICERLILDRGYPVTKYSNHLLSMVLAVCVILDKLHPACSKLNLPYLSIVSRRSIFEILVHQQPSAWEYFPQWIDQVSKYSTEHCEIMLRGLISPNNYLRPELSACLNHFLPWAVTKLEDLYADVTSQDKRNSNILYHDPIKLIHAIVNAVNSCLIAVPKLITISQMPDDVQKPLFPEPIRESLYNFGLMEPTIESDLAKKGYILPSNPETAEKSLGDVFRISSSPRISQAIEPLPFAQDPDHSISDSSTESDSLPPTSETEDYESDIMSQGFVSDVETEQLWIKDEWDSALTSEADPVSEIHEEPEPVPPIKSSFLSKLLRKKKKKPARNYSSGSISSTPLDYDSNTESNNTDSGSIEESFDQENSESISGSMSESISQSGSTSISGSMSESASSISNSTSDYESGTISGTASDEWSMSDDESSVSFGFSSTESDPDAPPNHRSLSNSALVKYFLLLPKLLCVLSTTDLAVDFSVLLKIAPYCAPNLSTYESYQGYLLDPKNNKQPYLWYCAAILSKVLEDKFRQATNYITDGGILTLVFRYSNFNPDGVISTFYETPEGFSPLQSDPDGKAKQFNELSDHFSHLYKHEIDYFIPYILEEYGRPNNPSPTCITATSIPDDGLSLSCRFSSTYSSFDAEPSELKIKPLPYNLHSDDFKLAMKAHLHRYKGINPSNLKVVGGVAAPDWLTNRIGIESLLHHCRTIQRLSITASHRKKWKLLLWLLPQATCLEDPIIQEQLEKFFKHMVLPIRYNGGVDALALTAHLIRLLPVKPQTTLRFALTTLGLRMRIDPFPQSLLDLWQYIDQQGVNNNFTRSMEKIIQRYTTAISPENLDDSEDGKYKSRIATATQSYKFFNYQTISYLRFLYNILPQNLNGDSSTYSSSDHFTKLADSVVRTCSSYIDLIVYFDTEFQRFSSTTSARPDLQNLTDVLQSLSRHEKKSIELGADQHPFVVIYEPKYIKLFRGMDDYIDLSSTGTERLLLICERLLFTSKVLCKLAVITQRLHVLEHLVEILDYFSNPIDWVLLPFLFFNWDVVSVKSPSSHAYKLIHDTMKTHFESWAPKFAETIHLYLKNQEFNFIAYAMLSYGFVDQIGARNELQIVEHALSHAKTDSIAAYALSNFFKRNPSSITEFIVFPESSEPNEMPPFAGKLSASTFLHPQPNLHLTSLFPRHPQFLNYLSNNRDAFIGMLEFMGTNMETYLPICNLLLSLGPHLDPLINQHLPDICSIADEVKSPEMRQLENILFVITTTPDMDSRIWKHLNVDSLGRFKTQFKPVNDLNDIIRLLQTPFAIPAWLNSNDVEVRALPDLLFEMNGSFPKRLNPISERSLVHLSRFIRFLSLSTGETRKFVLEANLVIDFLKLAPVKSMGEAAIIELTAAIINLHPDMATISIRDQNDNQSADTASSQDKTNIFDLWQSACFGKQAGKPIDPKKFKHFKLLSRLSALMLLFFGPNKEIDPHKDLKSLYQTLTPSVQAQVPPPPPCSINFFGKTAHKSIDFCGSCYIVNPTLDPVHLLLDLPLFKEQKDEKTFFCEKLQAPDFEGVYLQGYHTRSSIYHQYYIRFGLANRNALDQIMEFPQFRVGDIHGSYGISVSNTGVSLHSHGTSSIAPTFWTEFYNELGVSKPSKWKFSLNLVKSTAVLQTPFFSVDGSEPHMINYTLRNIDTSEPLYFMISYDSMEIGELLFNEGKAVGGLKPLGEMFAEEPITQETLSSITEAASSSITEAVLPPEKIKKDKKKNKDKKNKDKKNKKDKKKGY